MQAINLLIRNNPAFSESNLFDTMKFVLQGGVGDSVVLEENKDNKSDKTDYAGLYEVNARTAVLLISSGIDTFSKINYDQARKIVENSGVPIYVIGTGNLFLKKYDQYLIPGRDPERYAIDLRARAQPVQSRLHADQFAARRQAAQDPGQGQPRRQGRSEAGSSPASTELYRGGWQEEEIGAGTGGWGLG
jgi:hypothetical protein